MQALYNQSLVTEVKNPYFRLGPPPASFSTISPDSFRKNFRRNLPLVTRRAYLEKQLEQATVPNLAALHQQTVAFYDSITQHILAWQWQQQLSMAFCYHLSMVNIADTNLQALAYHTALLLQYKSPNPSLLYACLVRLKKTLPTAVFKESLKQSIRITQEEIYAETHPKTEQDAKEGRVSFSNYHPLQGEPRGNRDAYLKKVLGDLKKLR